MRESEATRTTNAMGVLARVVLFMVACAVALAITSECTPKLLGMWSQVCVGCVTSAIALGLTMLFVRWDGVSLKGVGAAPNGMSWLRAVVGFGLGSCIVGIWALVCVASGYIRWSFEPAVGFSSALVALGAYFSLACREELSFHGYPLRRLQQVWSVWPAQVFVAIVFGLEHRLGGSPWVQVVFGAFVGSLLFGMASIATRGLALPIGIHAAWNFGTWLLGMKGEPGVWRQIVEPANELRAEVAGMVAYVAVMGTATFLLWIYFRRIGNLQTSAAN